MEVTSSVFSPLSKEEAPCNSSQRTPLGLRGGGRESSGPAGAELAPLPLQDFLHSAPRGRLELRPPTEATRLPLKMQKLPAHTAAPRAASSLFPLRPRAGEGSAPSPRRGGLPATCPLPIPHAKRDRRGRKPSARPHRPCAAAATASSSPTLSVCAYPACTSRPRAISELQPRGQSGRKKQEVWDGPSRGAGSPKLQALNSALPLPFPRPLPLAHFPGVRFGGWPELQKSRCVWGSFKAHSQGSLRLASPGFMDRAVGRGGSSPALVGW